MKRNNGVKAFSGGAGALIFKHWWRSLFNNVAGKLVVVLLVVLVVGGGGVSFK